ncbi:carbohydrate kinase family protein [Ruicaihuangia caeni]|uniref:Carbohydrate kinase family protein n=1 Tax=Ruicaihuangia caeni TaxID=3042517 RepID=A0AAW6TAB9_9MICO|nr:carbohydrate kinase family protein [Klugiella sp. YN-L-19]MDI2099349.1 carbohydrate kinase family protein [Klugiella sp. YN-L-19]
MTDAGIRGAIDGSQRASIAVFGDVIDDIVVRPLAAIRPDTDTPASIERRAGGSAANVAAWLGSIGAPVRFYGRVGRGDRAHHAALLDEFGVEAELVEDSRLPTGTIVVLLEGEGRRTMLTERGANAVLTTAEVGEWLWGADSVRDRPLPALVHFTAYSVFNDADAVVDYQAFIARCHDAGITVSVDASSAGSLTDFGVERFLDAVAGASVLLPNLDEGRVLTGLDDPLEIVRALGVRFEVVAMTMGREGVVVCAPGLEATHVPVRPVDDGDPIGAGDAFTAAFLDDWLRTADAVSAALAGGRLAARALARTGARP